jgi:hypothetical protein
LVRAHSRRSFLTLGLESTLAAASPLAPKAIDQSFDLRLQGDMARYAWPLNGIVFDTAHPAAKKPRCGSSAVSESR